MGDRIEALEALAEKVVDAAIEPRHSTGVFKELGFSQMSRAASAYYGSLDAAKALHEAMLPGYEHGMDSVSMVWVKKPGLRTNYRASYGNNPSRAWLIAILRALIAEAKEASYGSS